MKDEAIFLTVFSQMRLDIKQIFTSDGKAWIAVMSVSPILICSKFCTQFIQKQTNMSLNMVLVELDFSVAKGMTMVGCNFL